MQVPKPKVERTSSGIKFLRMSLEEYMVWQLHQERKYEFHNGVVVLAMAGSKDRRHQTVGTNLIMFAGGKLPDRCDYHSSDQALYVHETERMFFPDGAITCGEIEEFTTDTGLNAITNPIVLFEVLSDTSEGYDRGEKMRNYTRLPSLRHLVFVTRNHAIIDVVTRTDAGDWKIDSVSGLDATLDLPAVGLSVPLREVYRKVTLDPDLPDLRGVDEG